MRRLGIWLVTVLAFVAAPALAEVLVNDRADIAIDVFVDCANGGAGEMVTLTGPLHTVITETFSGRNVSGKFHFQPQGVTGTGEVTGASYHATGVTQQTFKTSLQNGQGTLSFVNNFRIIGQGTGNNFLVHETMHLTFNADGTLTVTHDDFSAECK